MANKSIVWIPRKDEETASKHDVLEIILAAHEPQNQTTPGPSDPSTKMTNHWQIFLQWGPEDSIRLDPSPNYPNMDMTLSCTAGGKDYACTANVHKVVRLTPAMPITVGGFLEILTRNKYDKYIFTSHGTGCRYWISCVMDLLTERGVIDGSSANEAMEAINVVWKQDQPLGAGNQTSFKDHQGKFIG